jgi:hypothetical protein
MKHPREEHLALFAGGDVGPFERWRVSRHLRACPECRAEVGHFEVLSGIFTEEAERLPEGVNWDRLAAEMKANIRLGLVAGECVSAAGSRPQRPVWRPAAVLASAALLLITAWWLNIPPEHHQMNAQHRQTVEAPVVQVAPGGIEVKANSATLTLLRRKAATPVLYVSSPGSLRERFVDADTGQITINNVYTE